MCVMLPWNRLINIQNSVDKLRHQEHVCVLVSGVYTKGRLYCHVKSTLCLMESVICYLITTDQHSLDWSEEADGWDLQLLTPLDTLRSWTTCSQDNSNVRLWTICFDEWPVEGGADTSQQSAEFDTWTESSPLPLKGFHWHVKQQTESQCDCLSNEKITALHLTENDLGQEVWVNKNAPLTNGPLTCCSLQRQLNSTKLIDAAVTKPQVSSKSCHVIHLMT